MNQLNHHNAKRNEVFLHEYIDKYGAASFHYLLEELEQSLLASFKLMLDGTEADSETLKKAAQITNFLSTKLFTSTLYKLISV